MGWVTYGETTVHTQILSVTYEGVEYRCKERMTRKSEGGRIIRRSLWLSRDGQFLDDLTAMERLASVARTRAVASAREAEVKERAALLAELYPSPEPAPLERTAMKEPMQELLDAIIAAQSDDETLTEAIERLAAVADKGIIARADSNERALADIRALLLLEPGWNALEHLLAMVPLSEWIREGLVWYRMLTSGKRVYEVWSVERSYYKRSSCLRGTQQDKYQSAVDAMRASDAEHAEVVRICAARRAARSAPEAEK